MGLGRQDLHPQRANSHYHTAVSNTLMPPRPFPSALRLGTDICNVSRIRAMLARGKELSHVHKFTKKILTTPERAYFWNRFGPPEDISTKLDIASNFLAGRFAAKEAIRKACDHFEDSTRGFQSIMILPVAFAPRQKHQSVRPQGLILDSPYVSKIDVELHTLSVGHKSSYNVDDLDGQLCEISISHDGDFAIAVALVPSMSEQPMDEGISEASRP
ncbi:hypothetical protein HBI57_145060 [Parastagonospora nodorum]|nr:hypothetical protein HBI12_001770 [Parastagonospora nodorum]KAH6453957.1 hypothetical protein HBI57_145060 [Parastagonospora nodorum]KAH6460297.1 hypothetical protein HBI58_189440 [Parastagonospora nodorum]